MRILVGTAVLALALGSFGVASAETHKSFARAQMKAKASPRPPAAGQRARPSFGSAKKAGPPARPSFGSAKKAGPSAGAWREVPVYRWLPIGGSNDFYPVEVGRRREFLSGERLRQFDHAADNATGLNALRDHGQRL